MGGVGKYVYSQCRGGASEAAGADAKFVDFVEKFSFELSNGGVVALAADGSEQGFLAEVGGAFHRASDADAHDDGWAGIAAGMTYSVDNKLLDTRDAGTGGEHLQSALVLAAESFGGDGDVEPVAGHHLVVDDGGCIVGGVHAVDGVAHHRFAQVAFAVALTDALVDGIFDKSAGDMYVLSHLNEDDGHAGVLAHGALLVFSDVGILDDSADNLTCQRRFLHVGTFDKTSVNIAGEHVARLDAETLYQLGNLGCFYFSHLAVSCEEVLGVPVPNVFAIVVYQSDEAVGFCLLVVHEFFNE